MGILLYIYSTGKYTTISENLHRKIGSFAVCSKEGKKPMKKQKALGRYKPSESFLLVNY